MEPLQLTINSDEAMQGLGRQLARVLMPGDLVYLIGNLGAGKTTLVRGFARASGYKGRVTSPTFTLMNIYETDPPIYHFDFYRLEGVDLAELGLDDYLERAGISFIEWPLIGNNSLPEEALVINIEITDDDYDRERCVELRAIGEQYEKRLEGLIKYVAAGDR